MPISAQRFFKELLPRKVAFIGIGVSHTELISLFCEKGIFVSVHDKRSRAQVGESLCASLEEKGARLFLGEDYLESVTAEVIFRTPGMYYHTPFLREARNQGRVVTSEMEVFFSLCPCKTIAVTGSDGKTTTTALIAELLRAQGKTVHLGGNIGKALLPQIERIREDDFAVVELSSFQLISMSQSPDIAVVTNISPNHLDVHGTMEEYIAAKRNLVRHQDAFSKTVLRMGDPVLAERFAPLVRGTLAQFSRSGVVPRGAYMDENGDIWHRSEDEEVRIMHSTDIRLPGQHNIENMLAAISAVWGIVEGAAIKRVAQSFAGVEHRIELVRELDGVRWYNDSIATSPTRTMAGLDAFGQRLILIAGGYDKKIPYEPLAPKLAQRVKTLILMGATAPAIERALRSHPDFDEARTAVLHAKSMEDAVRLAKEAAQAGDIVSLSPASASFDLYRNFEERGNHFKALVHALEGENT